MSISELLASRIVPVLVLKDPSNVGELARVLVENGLPVAEVTLRTSAAPEAIAEMANDPRIHVGAGTVVNAAQVDLAVDAGARFIVSPGLSLSVIARARERGVPVIPGAVTPTEVMQALEAGITTVKYFPSHILGGVAAIKALRAPFPDVQFVPTGGVSAANLEEYLSVPCVPAVCGTWMVPAKMVDDGRFDIVADLVREAVAAVAALGAQQARAEGSHS